MPIYDASYPAGTTVRVADEAALVEFRDKWKAHNPLTEEMIACAGREAAVKSVGYYHGGDPLYVLVGVPGVWHEVCLRPRT